MQKSIKKVLLLLGCFYAGKGAILIWKWYRLTQRLKFQANNLPGVKFSEEFGATPFSSLARLISQLGTMNHYRFDQFEKHGVETYISASISPKFIVESNVTTRDKAIIKHVFSDKFRTYLKMSGVAVKFFGKTLATIAHGPYSEDKGKFFLHQRKSLTGIFKALEDSGMLESCIQRHASKMVKRIQSEHKSSELKSVDMKMYMRCFTFEATCEIAFGYKFKNTDEANKYQECFENIFGLMIYAIIHPLWKIPYSDKFLSKKKRYVNSINQLHGLCFDIIAQRKQMINNGEPIPEDVLSMAMSESTSPEFATDVYLRDLVMLVLIAGRDTTSKSLQFILMHLALDEKRQEKLFDEIEGCFDEGILNRDKLYNNWYLDAVIKESMRLYPIVTSLARKAAKPDVLPNGLKISEGQIIRCDLFSICRSKEIFDKPHEFIPERWDQDKVDWDIYDTFQLPVFSSGPRICLGKRVALFEMKLSLAALIQKYRFKLNDTEEKLVKASRIRYGSNMLTEYKFDLCLDMIQR